MKDVDFDNVHRELRLSNAGNNNTEVKNALRAIGETRKKAKNLVVEGTQFIMNTTERIGNSFISLVNGENRDNFSNSPSNSSSTTVSASGSASASASASSSSLHSGKTKRKYEPRHIPIIEEEDPVILPEIRKNMDETDSV